MELVQISNWAKNNGLALSPKKFKCLIIYKNKLNIDFLRCTILDFRLNEPKEPCLHKIHCKIDLILFIVKDLRLNFEFLY